MLSFEWRTEDLRPIFNREIERATAKAYKRAGGDAIRAVRVDSSRYIRERKRLKVAFVNKSLVLDFPRGTDIAGMQWRMRARGLPVPLMDYGARQAKRTGFTTVQVNKGGPRKLVKSAFIATMPSGHRGVFARTPGVPVRRSSEGAALPIHELFSTRVSDLFRDVGMVPGVFVRAEKVFGTSFDRNLSNELAKVK